MTVGETPRRRAQQGFTYLWVLLAIAFAGIGLMAASEVWVTTARHHQRVQLDWVQRQYRHAIASYYERSPGTVRTYPESLEQLLEDRRFLFVRRHIRNLYANPLTGRMDWTLVPAPYGGIAAVTLPP